ncbi:H4MPT-linked C1 transfer pathway protein [Archaeoglobales archaeon]|nr:MAG: H4MPT-linked C1 transfer pathway protein [Archaeoglobales archaeon]
MSSFNIGLDIGGANLKVASVSEGEIIYFPMWKKWKELDKQLFEIREKYKPENVGVVITAELADAFDDKVEGVKYISSVVKKVFSNCNVFYLDINGEIKDKIDNPRLFAASNWVASTKFLLKNYKNFLFADMGSTTTDLIPVTDKIEAGKTDYERLKRGELLYFGVLRTPVFYVLPEFNSVPLTSEYFSITGDVFVLTDDISAEDYNCETPDGKDKHKDDCMKRLARTLCCDVSEIGEDKIFELAELVKEEIIKKTSDTILRLASKYKLSRVIGCGIGEFILEKATKRANLDYISLKENFGDFSHLFPAYAMAKLIESKYITMNYKKLSNNHPC